MEWKGKERKGKEREGAIVRSHVVHVLNRDLHLSSVDIEVHRRKIQVTRRIIEEIDNNGAERVVVGGRGGNVVARIDA